MDKYAIFGDSYVSRLNRYTGGRLDFIRPHRFFGVPGMSTRRKFEDAFQRMLDYQPRYVFINLGGNDITADCDPKSIAADILNIVSQLKDAGVERVMVASIIQRGRFPSWTGLSVNTFNVKRQCVNRNIKKHLPRGDFIEIGRRLQYTRHYDRDLVHPGEEEGGMKVFKYEVLKSFRRTLG